MTVRVTVDIDDCGQTQGTKEAVAMALEPLGRVRVVSVQVSPGAREKSIGEYKQMSMGG